MPERSHPTNSLLHYSPAVIVVAIAVADSGRFADPDLWGHVRFGQAVLSAGHLITADPYSYSAPGHLWLNHEWLSEVLMGWLYNAFGILGLKAMKFACSTVMVIGLTMALSETDADIMVQLALLLASCVAIAPQMEFRPQAFTFALLAILMAVLARLTFRGRAPIWIAIPLLALWANLHGAFIMGLATLGIYSAATGAIDIAAGRGIGRALRLFAITALATLVTLATPYGIGTWQAVLHALHNPHTRVVVNDWQPISRAIRVQLTTGPFAAYFIYLAIVIYLATATFFALTPETIDAPLVAVAAVMVVSAIIAIRNLPIAVITSVIPLVYHADQWLKRRRSATGLSEAQPLRASPTNQAIVLTVALALAIQTGLFSPRMAAGDPYPVGAVQFMKEHGITGNMLLGTFGWGEYLIWHMSPQTRVFIDGRYDTVFPSEVIDDYFAFHFAQPGAARTLAKYPHDLILVSKDMPAYKMISDNPDWKLIYSDNESALFARASSPAAHLPGVPVMAKAPPSNFP